MDIDTPHGPARFDIAAPSTRPRGLLVLTHGAGGGVDAPDLLALCEAARAAGLVVARVTQPYRVAGRKAPGKSSAQDEAWCAVVRHVRARTEPGQLPLVVCGRSNGARVACRTARSLGAQAVVALAFPLRPPRRPEHSRVAELRSTGVPTLVVNGDRDPFGVPDPSDATTLDVRPGERHELAKAPDDIAQGAVTWMLRYTE
ncbi:alpha/beta hydrolase family protein [Haloactinospora alba]|nr:alpha/beta family hydrolase [Haloactinospora alba]